MAIYFKQHKFETLRRNTRVGGGRGAGAGEGRQVCCQYFAA